MTYKEYTDEEHRTWLDLLQQDFAPYMDNYYCTKYGDTVFVWQDSGVAYGNQYNWKMDEIKKAGLKVTFVQSIDWLGYIDQSTFVAALLRGEVI